MSGAGHPSTSCNFPEHQASGSIRLEFYDERIVAWMGTTRQRRFTLRGSDVVSKSLSSGGLSTCGESVTVTQAGRLIGNRFAPAL